MAKKKESSITKTREITSLGTMTRTGDAIPSVEELLGPKQAHLINDDVFLLKLDNLERIQTIADSLKLPLSKVEDSRFNAVLGPMSKSQLLSLVELQLLTRNDELLVPQGTWKPIVDVVSEIKLEQLLKEELTSTLSMTESITETAASAQKQQEEETKIDSDKRDVQKPESLQTNTRKETPRSQRSIGARANIKAPVNISAPKVRAVWPLYTVIGLGLVVLSFFAIPWLKTFPRGSSSSSDPLTRAGWPENVRPKSFERLYEGRSPVLARLDPILEAYDRGAKAISEPDMQLLRVLSGPGSASLEARISSSNLLAALALSKAQSVEAKRILDKTLELQPTNTTTLLNKSLTFLVNREYREAKEVASTALRLCAGQSCWVARSMLGLISAEENRWVESEEHFRVAMELSRGNMWVVGLWLRSLNGAPKETARSRATQLLTESLVLDPDMMIDSPLRAPLATQIFLSELLTGFRGAMTVAPEALTEGQKKYFEWLLSRLELNPLATSAQEALDKLKNEAVALSQLAAAYLEKENGRLDKSAEILSRTLTRFSGTNIKSSWPWSFAGDVQRNRGLYDQAIVFYEGALSRNPRDVNAVYGLALILRERGEHRSALQKIEESRSIDPSYIPSELRCDRFEWQRYWLSR